MEPQSSLAASTSDSTYARIAPAPTDWSTDSIPPNPSEISGTRIERSLTSPGQHIQSEEPTQSNCAAPTTPLGQLPQGEELEHLVQVYFSSVHDFGFYGFIHQLHFNRLLAQGKAPRELTLMMVASVMRFAAAPTEENLARGDAWADAAISVLLQQIYQGFGAVQLMTLLLAHHYDFHRGNFTSSWLLGANCTRMMQMMSLQTFDRTYPSTFASNLRLPLLLSAEALRRVAWSTFYADSIVDGGRYGFHIVDENAYRVQLPCDPTSFLADENVTTEPLFVDLNSTSNTELGIQNPAQLDMSAYLLRAAAARRRALHFAFRASHKEQTVERLCEELIVLKADIDKVINDLPKRFIFNSDNMFLHRDRLSAFLLLHIMRHNLFVVITRAALQVYQRDLTKADDTLQVRRERISHALATASLVFEGLKADIIFDPHIGIFAYVALEILLFEPRRLAEADSVTDTKAPELIDAVYRLLAVLRDLSARSEILRQLRIEAVHRILKCECGHLLGEADLAALRSEYQLAGSDAAEYDFRDFRWAKVERIRRGAWSSTYAARDEGLLVFKSGRDTTVPSAAPSPRLDAIEVRKSLTQPSALNSDQSMASSSLQAPEGLSKDPQSMPQLARPWWGLSEPENVDQMFSLDWTSFLDESGYPEVTDW
ncbi:hypothetical protein H2204_005641 [Knufia peltigerae]|nr:hypothetical protein H2204_005641 [Knufia peltigerae]